MEEMKHKYKIVKGPRGYDLFYALTAVQWPGGCRVMAAFELEEVGIVPVALHSLERTSPFTSSHELTGEAHLPGEVEVRFWCRLSYDLSTWTGQLYSPLELSPTQIDHSADTASESNGCNA